MPSGSATAFAKKAPKLEAWLLPQIVISFKSRNIASFTFHVPPLTGRTKPPLPTTAFKLWGWTLFSSIASITNALRKSV